MPNNFPTNEKYRLHLPGAAPGRDADKEIPKAQRHGDGRWTATTFDTTAPRRKKDERMRPARRAK